jgi:hypothetical protein
MYLHSEKRNWKGCKAGVLRLVRRKGIDSFPVMMKRLKASVRKELAKLKETGIRNFKTLEGCLASMVEMLETNRVNQTLAAFEREIKDDLGLTS